MTKKDRNIIYLFIIVAAVLSVAIPWWLSQSNATHNQETPHARTIKILERGLDTSNSKFTPGENAAFEEEVNLKVQELKERPAVTSQEVLNLARTAKDVRDYEMALALFSVVEELGSDDYLVKVDIGKMYLAMNNADKAVEYFEKSRLEYPSLYESYIGLAEAYKQILDTPQYVIDDVYRTAIQEIPGQYELYEAYIDWLEDTGREKETIQYYEILNIINPQALLEQRIQELKNKHQ